MKTFSELEAMSNDELNEQLAHAFGIHPRRSWAAGSQAFDVYPNYCGDLNIVAEAEKKLTDEQANSYINTISDSINPMGDAGWKADFLYITATARQRTIALILTLQHP